VDRPRAGTALQMTEGLLAKGRTMRGAITALLVTLLVSGTACTSPESVAREESVAYKLAVVDGDPGKEEEFQEIIDCIMATGIEGAETEEQVGDTLVASWEAGGRPGSLLSWAQALCSMGAGSAQGKG
jgi:NAD(P)H-hydrate repair Nnr-like enzyme with NAD(P)H-hydrate epimerase domain